MNVDPPRLASLSSEITPISSALSPAIYIAPAIPTLSNSGLYSSSQVPIAKLLLNSES